ncbi:MAG: porin family protein [Spirosomataceae bacterium]
MKIRSIVCSLAIAAGLFLSSQTVLAQIDETQAVRGRTGIRAGFNASNLYVKDVSDRNPRYGFHAGLFTQVPIIKGFLYLQPEISYSTKGFTARYNIANTFRGENSFKLDYIEVPVLATIKLGNFVDIHGGVYGGLLTKASVESKGDGSFGSTTLNRDNFNNLDYGLAAGLSIYLGNFMIGTRYNYGLRPVAYTNAARVFLGDAKNSAAQVSLGITF